MQDLINYRNQPEKGPKIHWVGFNELGELQAREAAQRGGLGTRMGTHGHFPTAIVRRILRDFLSKGTAGAQSLWRCPRTNPRTDCTAFGMSQRKILHHPEIPRWPGCQMRGGSRRAAREQKQRATRARSGPAPPQRPGGAPFASSEIQRHRWARSSRMTEVGLEYENFHLPWWWFFFSFFLYMDVPSEALAEG